MGIKLIIIATKGGLDLHFGLGGGHGRLLNYIFSHSVFYLQVFSTNKTCFLGGRERS